MSQTFAHPIAAAAATEFRCKTAAPQNKHLKTGATYEWL
ncbi:hypothetical protein MTBUT4_80065 [Magnetospirillum sp. UT-4]|nr:hypothetical protein MTBUT4_80065 [Magnetospirillum sp. UT-4]